MNARVREGHLFGGKMVAEPTHVSQKENADGSYTCTTLPVRV
jgi:hypothetical protein